MVKEYIFPKKTNKFDYIRLKAEAIMVKSVKPQIDAFLEGFYSVIQSDLIANFTVEELEQLISGSERIDVDDWQRNTVFEGLKKVVIKYDGFGQMFVILIKKNANYCSISLLDLHLFLWKDLADCVIVVRSQDCLPFVAT